MRGEQRGGRSSGVFDAGFNVGVGGEDEFADGGSVRRGTGLEFNVAHEFAGTQENAGRIGESIAVKEADVDVGGEDVDVGEGCVAEAGDGAAVMEDLADFIAAFAHDGEPMLGDVAEFAGVALHPGFDGGVTLESAVEAKERFFHESSRSAGPQPGDRMTAGESCPAEDRRSRIMAQNGRERGNQPSRCDETDIPRVAKSARISRVESEADRQRSRRSNELHSSRKARVL